MATYSGIGPSIPVSISAVSGGGTASAPEMDAGTAFGALSLLAGLVAVLRARQAEVPTP